MEVKLFLGQYLIWVILLLGQLHGCKSCIQKEKSALLELKEYLISKWVEGESDYVLTTWTNDTKSNCCEWEGIECNPTSERVIGLSVGYMEFKEYSLLNLSLLHPFEEVRSLSLSSGHQYSENEFFNQFNGFFDDVKGYKSLRTLRNLEILDLSSNRFNNTIFPFLNAATSLTTLFLRSNILEGPFPFKELKDLTNLELLDMGRNYFYGSISDLFHLKRLKALDLGSNKFSSSMELQALNNSTNLEVLGLADNELDGPIPIEVVCKMKNLRELYLSDNYFVGQLPLCLGRLNNLQVLDLSYNQISGNLPSSFSGLESLEYLSLLDNNFTGLFSLNPLANVTTLEVLKLSSTSDMVQVKTESSWKPKFQPSVVVLRSSNLEKIPSFLMYQKNLLLVDLSSNRLSGDIPTWMLVNSTNLKVLQLQKNSFTIFQMPTVVHNILRFLDFSANNIGGLFPDNIGRALPNLMHMNGSDNGFSGYFPSSLGDMKNIFVMDLSYNNFYGKLPRRFLTGCVSLKYLFLSHNKLNGQFLPEGTNFTSMEVLSMDNNNFTGKIGVGLLSSNNTLLALDMSNNCLTGTIPSWISTISYLDILSVSNNFLEGTIPPSLVNIRFLDISRNLLSGALPSHSPSSILFLHNNNFKGVIPDTLLEHVKILDLRNNKLFGSIPKFVDTHHIRILLLSGNNLTGSIPRHLCDLSKIRLLDLSDNKLSGFIPSCLNNLSFGRGKESAYNRLSTTLGSLDLEFYKYTFMVEELEVDYFTFQKIEIKFATKQRYDSYFGGSGFNKGILDYMYGLDLSSNELSGVIPEELGDLSNLRALNLSHNFLSSSIPPNFSNLKDIESLDLSHNMLQESIPQQLTSLDFLALLDVSYNNLSGIIPQGRHFDTFDENSYMGNLLLCGPPTDRSCEANKSSEEAVNGGGEGGDEVAIDMVVFYFSTGATYVTALIGILVLMCFDCPWRRAWLRIVEASIASTRRMLP